uniref:Uncharacterized protein n=1 Tax=Catharus ustulatus TaxID=91951 RepID=A0A8C3V7P8_CATUS
VKHGRHDPARSTYEWRPCTPPSTWADVVLFSNFSSPEYIMALRRKDTCQKPGRVQGRQCSDRSSAGKSGMKVTSSSSCTPRNQAGRSTRLGPPWWQPGESPSSLAQEQHISSSGSGCKIPWGSWTQQWLQSPCPQPPAAKYPHAQCDAIWKDLLGDSLQ